MTPPKTRETYNPFTLIDEIRSFAYSIVTGLGVQGDVDAAAAALAIELSVTIDEFTNRASKH